MERWSSVEGYEGRYGSVMEAGRDGFSFKHISTVCLGKRQRHAGFYWRFEKDLQMKAQMVRQGDVLLVPTSTIPPGCTEIQPDGNRIVLAYGEVTFHSHAIYDHITQRNATPGAADEIAEAAIARAQSKARLLLAPNGERYLEVTETVTLKHEEHSQHTLPPGIYHLPKQMEYTPAELRRVAD